MYHIILINLLGALKKSMFVMPLGNSQKSTICWVWSTFQNFSKKSTEGTSKNTFEHPLNKNTLNYPPLQNILLEYPHILGSENLKKLNWKS